MNYKEQVENEFSEIWLNMYSELNLVVWDCSLFLTETKKYIVLDCISVRDEKQGVGSKAMTILCDFADKYNLRIYLMPIKIAETPFDVLLKFYSKFGFKHIYSKTIPIEYKTYHSRKPNL